MQSHKIAKKENITETKNIRYMFGKKKLMMIDTIEQTNFFFELEFRSKLFFLQ